MPKIQRQIWPRTPRLSIQRQQIQSYTKYGQNSKSVLQEIGRYSCFVITLDLDVRSKDFFWLNNLFFNPRKLLNVWSSHQMALSSLTRVPHFGHNRFGLFWPNLWHSQKYYFSISNYIKLDDFWAKKVSRIPLPSWSKPRLKNGHFFGKMAFSAKLWHKCPTFLWHLKYLMGPYFGGKVQWSRCIG